MRLTTTVDQRIKSIMKVSLLITNTSSFLAQIIISRQVYGLEFNLHCNIKRFI